MAPKHKNNIKPQDHPKLSEIITEERRNLSSMKCDKSNKQLSSEKSHSCEISDLFHTHLAKYTSFKKPSNSTKETLIKNSGDDERIETKKEPKILIPPQELKLNKDLKKELNLSLCILCGTSVTNPLLHNCKNNIPNKLKPGQSTICSCGLNCVTLERLNYHTENQCTKKLFERKIFASLKSEENLRNKNNFICTFCGIDFKYAEIFADHKRQCPKSKKLSTQPNTCEGTFLCPFCLVNCHTNIMLKDHRYFCRMKPNNIMVDESPVCSNLQLLRLKQKDNDKPEQSTTTSTNKSFNETEHVEIVEPNQKNVISVQSSLNLQEICYTDSIESDKMNVDQNFVETKPKFQTISNNEILKQSKQSATLNISVNKNTNEFCEHQNQSISPIKLKNNSKQISLASPDASIDPSMNVLDLSCKKNTHFDKKIPLNINIGNNNKILNHLSIKQSDINIEKTAETTKQFEKTSSSNLTNKSDTNILIQVGKQLIAHTLITQKVTKIGLDKPDKTCNTNTKQIKTNIPEKILINLGNARIYHNLINQKDTKMASKHLTKIKETEKHGSKSKINRILALKLPELTIRTKNIKRNFRRRRRLEKDSLKQDQSCTKRTNNTLTTEKSIYNSTAQPVIEADAIKHSENLSDFTINQPMIETDALKHSANPSVCTINQPIIETDAQHSEKQSVCSTNSDKIENSDIQLQKTNDFNTETNISNTFNELDDMEIDEDVPNGKIFIFSSQQFKPVLSYTKTQNNNEIIKISQENVKNISQKTDKNLVLNTEIQNKNNQTIEETRVFTWEDCVQKIEEGGEILSESIECDNNKNTNMHYIAYYFDENTLQNKEDMSLQQISQNIINSITVNQKNIDSFVTENQFVVEKSLETDSNVKFDNVSLATTKQKVYKPIPKTHTEKTVTKVKRSNKGSKKSVPLDLYEHVKTIKRACARNTSYAEYFEPGIVSQHDPDDDFSMTQMSDVSVDNFKLPTKKVLKELKYLDPIPRMYYRDTEFKPELSETSCKLDKYNLRQRRLSVNYSCEEDEDLKLSEKTNLTKQSSEESCSKRLKLYQTQKYDRNSTIPTANIEENHMKSTSDNFKRPKIPVLRKKMQKPKPLWQQYDNSLQQYGSNFQPDIKNTNGCLEKVTKRPSDNFLRFIGSMPDTEQ